MFRHGESGDVVSSLTKCLCETAPPSRNRRRHRGFEASATKMTKPMRQAGGGGVRIAVSIAIIALLRYPPSEFPVCAAGAKPLCVRRKSECCGKKDIPSGYPMGYVCNVSPPCPSPWKGCCGVASVFRPIRSTSLPEEGRPSKGGATNRLAVMHGRSIPAMAETRNAESGASDNRDLLPSRSGHSRGILIP